MRQIFLANSWCLGILLIAAGVAGADEANVPTAISDHRQPAFLGVELSDTGNPLGCTVVRVIPKTTAQAHGLRPGDVILEVNRVRTPTSDAVDRIVATLKEDDRCSIGIDRNRVRGEIVVHMMKKPKASDLLIQTDPPRAFSGTVSSAGGTIDGDLDMPVDFVVIGRANVTGSFRQHWPAVLDIDIRDPNTKSVVKVSGAVVLNGMLHVSTSGFTANTSMSLEVISGATSMSGRFEEIMLPKLSNELSWELIYDDINRGIDLDRDGKHDVTLRVVLANYRSVKP